MKYLILEFKNAKLIRTHKGTKDRFSEFGLVSSDRKNIKNFKEPITKFQVSNMLHVLMGERPINTQRHSFYQNQQWIFNLKSYIKYNTPIVKVSKDKYGFFKEKTRVNKSAWNSWATPTLNWELIRNYCDDNFDLIISELNKVYKDPMNKPFRQVCEDIQKDQNRNKYITLFNLIKSIGGIDGLYTLLDKPDTKPSIISVKKMSLDRRGTALTYINGIDSAEFYSGEIIVEIDDNMEQRIREHYKGTCTILDGGVVSIKSIENDIEMNYFKEFVDVHSISIDKV